MKSSRLLDFASYVFARFSQHNCTQVAGSLTFTTLLSLVPLIAIALSIVAAFPAFSDFFACFATRSAYSTSRNASRRRGSRMVRRGKCRRGYS